MDLLKKDLRILLCNFWVGYDQLNNMFSHLLSRHYNLTIDYENPQVIIYTRYNTEERKFYYDKNVLKIYWTADPIILDQDTSKGSIRRLNPLYEFESYEDKPVLEDHYALTSDLCNYHPHHYHLPYYIHSAYYQQEQLLTAHLNTPDWTTKKDISFVYTNHHPWHRNYYFEILSKYLKINSGGKHLNNIGYKVEDKQKFIQKHAFDLSIENCFEHGYTTEKLLEPIMAQTIPIYWGSTANIINPKRYIKAPPNPEDLVRHIHYLNKNPHIAQQIIQQPTFTDPNALKNEYDKLLNFLCKIIDNHLSKYKYKASHKKFII